MPDGSHSIATLNAKAGVNRHTLVVMSPLGVGGTFGHVRHIRYVQPFSQSFYC